MKADDLRELQAPFKARYKDQPEAALITLRAQGDLDDSGIACTVDTGKALVEAGLHPSTGGSGVQACSGDMLLQALCACAGVTMRAVATALEIPIRKGVVRTEGVLDVRGTLGVDRDAAVGFKSIDLAFDLDTDASEAQFASLFKLTERYCVVFQTLSVKPELTVSRTVNGAEAAA